MSVLKLNVPSFYFKVKNIGYASVSDEYEKRKLGVFNQLNFLGIISGVLVSVMGLFDDQSLPFVATIVAISPALISAIVLALNHHHKLELARIVYFTCYPLLTAMVYGAGLDVGIELFFVLYALLAVFYMQRPINSIICFLLAAGCYTVVFVYKLDYSYYLRSSLFPFYVFNHILALTFIFFALFWIKRENTGYQLSILHKNEELYLSNLEIQEQKKIISDKAEQLTELNTVKNKLFSVISHDLKGPLYAQRNLFKSMHQYDVPAEEIKMILPEILTDMNYTINLMDNLLHWARCQMQSDQQRPQQVNISELIDSTSKLLRLQADQKQIYLELKVNKPLYVYADRDMLNLVLRNLMSNAIKFTPEKGEVIISATAENNMVSISIQDSGVGMKPEVLNQIKENNFYSTAGTANESGTGLGLMLCRDFLKKNGAEMEIDSAEGKGSRFSFSLPLLN